MSFPEEYPENPNAGSYGRLRQAHQFGTEAQRMDPDQYYSDSGSESYDYHYETAFVPTSGGLYGQNQPYQHTTIDYQSELSAEPMPHPTHLGVVCDDILQLTQTLGLDYGPEGRQMVRSFVAAITAKPFVIFSGLAGAGKTQLATALGRWFGSGHALLCPVRPDWDTPAAVLGEENPNSETVNSLHSWNVPRCLELMLTAIRNPSQPYLLVFEEMNLAHVEQYFADVLSGMESGHPIIPNLTHDGRGWRLLAKDNDYLPWPKNLYVIGTINMDETTYKISPKVLDRAAFIEFRVPPGTLRNQYEPAQRPDRANSHFLDLFMQRTQTEAPTWPASEQMATGLQALHRMLYDLDSEFGHRAFRESLRFGALLHDAGEHDVRTALDYALLYKVLPKYDNEKRPREYVMQHLAGFALHGSGKHGAIDPLELHEVIPVLPKSYAKTVRILRRLRYG